MNGQIGQENEYHKSNQHDRASGEQTSHDTAAEHDESVMPLGLAGLMQSAGIGASYNASVRAQGMLQAQQMHGNRAVQRALATSGTTRRTAVQRMPDINHWLFSDEENDEAGAARKGRTTASKTVTSLREGANALTAASAAAVAQEHDSWWAYTEALKQGNSKETAAAIAAHDEALKGKELAENTKGYQRRMWMNDHLGSTSNVGRGLRASNYGLQFWENMTKGQGLGEGIFGAAAGGWMNNNITRKLFDKKFSIGGKSFGGSPKAGFVDTAINLVNAGLNLIPGMPNEVTGLTQTAADATPSSFATSVASNAGRGLWNLGEGIVTGDWDGLKKQGDSIVRGKEGGPLQGYGLLAKSFTMSREEMAEATDDMRKGEYGFLPKMSLELKDWATDRWDSWMGRGTKKQRENMEMREIVVRAQNRKRERDEAKQKEQFDKEMAQYSAAARGDYYRPFQEQVMTAAPALDEDGEPIPYTPMALPR